MDKLELRSSCDTIRKKKKKNEITFKHVLNYFLGEYCEFLNSNSTLKPVFQKNYNNAWNNIREMWNVFFFDFFFFLVSHNCFLFVIFGRMCLSEAVTGLKGKMREGKINDFVFISFHLQSAICRRDFRWILFAQYKIFCLLCSCDVYFVFVFPLE